MAEELKDIFIIRKDDRKILNNCVVTIADHMSRQNIVVTIEELKSQRSELLNRYLHGWIFRKQIAKKLNDAGILLTDDNGIEWEWDVEMLKSIYKLPQFTNKYEERKTIMIGGRMVETEVHPSKWSTKKFCEYCEDICRDALQRWGIVVEEPRGGIFKTYHDELQRVSRQ